MGVHALEDGARAQPDFLLKSLRNKPCESALSKTVAPGNYSTLKLHMQVLLVLLGKNEHSYRFPL